MVRAWPSPNRLSSFERQPQGQEARPAGFFSLFFFFCAFPSQIFGVASEHSGTLWHCFHLLSKPLRRTLKTLRQRALCSKTCSPIPILVYQVSCQLFQDCFCFLRARCDRSLRYPGCAETELQSAGLLLLLTHTLTLVLSLRYLHAIRANYQCFFYLFKHNVFLLSAYFWWWVVARYRWMRPGVHQWMERMTTRWPCRLSTT